MAYRGEDREQETENLISLGGLLTFGFLVYLCKKLEHSAGNRIIVYGTLFTLHIVWTIHFASTLHDWWVVYLGAMSSLTIVGVFNALDELLYKRSATYQLEQYHKLALKALERDLNKKDP